MTHFEAQHPCGSQDGMDEGCARARYLRRRRAAAPSMLALALLLGGARAGATAPISGLFPTGVDHAGQLLPANAQDPHYSLVQSADATAPGPAAYVVREGFPIPPWLANGPDSKWIGPKADQSSGNEAGDYVYRLTFDLTEFEPATAVITGRWSSDNAGVAIRLNGAATGITYDGNFGAFSPAFTIDTGFREGLNTLEFVVNNAGSSVNPTGFRAELSGEANPSAPPGTPPSITDQPDSQTVHFKDAATFRVGAYGSRPFGYQWRFSGRAIPGANADTYVIPFVSAIHGGAYDVVVTNEFGEATSEAATLRITFPSPAELSYEAPGPSSRRTGIAFSEIMYCPAARLDGKRLEFVELYNSNPYFEDLSGWRLSGDIAYTFPAGTVIAGNGILVVAAAPEDLRDACGVADAWGGWEGALPDNAGTVRLQKRSGAVVLETEYAAVAPWPAAAAGAGHSLVLVRPSYGENDARAWAASAARGGSPAAADPLPAGPLEQVRVNEVLARPYAGDEAFVELYNHGGRPVDLSGCMLAEESAADAAFRIPEPAVLGPGERIAFTAAQLGFELPAGGGTLLLANADETRVLDAVRFGGQAEGGSWGRDPDGADAWVELAEPSPAGPNAAPLVRDVVIHELMYHPLSGEDADEYVELFNRGSAAVDLGGWRFIDGIFFTFPPNTALAAGAHLVVARDRARLLERYPALDPARVVGDYTGALADGGERVALAMPDPSASPGAGDGAEPEPVWVLVDEVTYGDGGQWGTWADGGGSSLELVDAHSDNRLAPNWADSDESQVADWTLVEASGRLDHLHPAYGAVDQLQVLLLGPGEALVDDVQVIVAGSNRVQNGAFARDTAAWRFQGTHRTSRWEGATGYPSAGCLRLIASERGDHVANAARTTLRSTISRNTEVTIRARVRWVRGHPEILLRLRGGGLEAVGQLETPSGPGTPGTANSRAQANAGPAIMAVSHRPLLPAANEPVRVFAAVQDADGVASVALRYRLDPSAGETEVPLADDGTGPDESPGDGLFAGVIPGQARGQLVAFYVLATDRAEPPATTRYPADAPERECLVRAGETPASGAFGTYRLWMTKAVHDAWAAREKMSNEDVPVTFVYRTDRAFYSTGARYSGSSYTSPGYTSPTGSLCGYDITFASDDRLLGGTRVTLDWPIRDDTAQREQLMYWMLEQYGLPNMYRRYVRLFVNGVRRGSIYEDIQQPGADTVEEWYPEDAEGNLYKTDCWNEFDDAGNRIDPCVLNTLENFTTTGGAKKVERYRWNWRPRAVRGSANDFAPLFDLVDAINDRQAPLVALEARADLEHWMRTFAMNDLPSFWDAFGNPNAKNTFLYKPEQDGWKLMCWDFDVGLGVFNDPTTAPLFDVNDPTIARLYQNPAVIRMYWAALQEGMQTFFRAGAGTPINTLLQAKYQALRDDGLAAGNPASIESWIQQRRTYLQTQLNQVQATLRISTNGGQDFVSQQSSVSLSGTAPVSAHRLLVNGVEFPVSWSSTTAWSARFPLESGTNLFFVQAVDRTGQLLPGDGAGIRVRYFGTADPLPALRINEWMSANDSAVPDPADGRFGDWFEIYNAGTATVSLAGFRLSDNIEEPARYVIPSGFSLAPGAFLIVWADEQPQQAGFAGAVHVDFELRQAGESIFLFDSIGRLVDSVSFGAQAPDTSGGRWPDGAPAPCFAMDRATPGESNSSAVEAPPEPVITGMAPAAPDMLALEWTSLPQRLYQVEYSEAPAAGAWQAIGDPVAAAGATTRALLPVPAAAEQGYYRVLLLVP